MRIKALLILALLAATPLHAANIDPFGAPTYDVQSGYLSGSVYTDMVFLLVAPNGMSVYGYTTYDYDADLTLGRLNERLPVYTIDGVHQPLYTSETFALTFDPIYLLTQNRFDHRGESVSARFTMTGALYGPAIATNYWTGQGTITAGYHAWDDMPYISAAFDQPIPQGFGGEFTGGTNGGSVPEPSTAWMLIAGLAAMAVAVRKHGTHAA